MPNCFYTQHTQNLRIINNAIDTVEIALRNEISLGHKRNEVIYTRILSGLVNSWIEIKLIKLLNEQKAFSDLEKSGILKSRSLNLKWKKTLEISFCKAFNLKNLKNLEKRTDIPFTSKSQFRALQKIIQEELLKSTELRNKIAHGQWVYAFDNNMSKINGKLTGILKSDNILVLEYRFEIFKNLCQIIQDLSLSKPTFERDFNCNYQKIEHTLLRQRQADINDYRLKLVLKRKQGYAKKNIPTQSANDDSTVNNKSGSI